MGERMVEMETDQSKDALQAHIGHVTLALGYLRHASPALDLYAAYKTTLFMKARNMRSPQEIEGESRKEVRSNFCRQAGF